MDFFTFYATTGAVKCNHQLVVATTVYIDQCEDRISKTNRTRLVNRLNVLLQHSERHFIYAVSYFEFCFFWGENMSYSM